MPVQGELTSETWGADNVKPRYIDNGIEDNEWSYWGGNAVLGTDGKYHLYVCRWREDSRRGTPSGGILSWFMLLPTYPPIRIE